MPERSVPAPDTLPADLADLVSRCQGLPLPRLVEELRADQARRWRAGQRLLAEAYLEVFPALASSAEDALVLVWGEALLRFERGEAPQPSEYRARFPQHADTLAAQFELERHLEPPPNAATLPPGEPPGAAGPPRPQVPGYEVLEELGRGGMGVVYKARHLKLNRLVALKMILAGSHAGGQELARFRAEAEAVARLQHPNIVQIYEVGEHGGLPYFTLEFCPGGSLAAQLDGTSLPPHRAAQLVEVLARAVHAAHQCGIIHRDLKPANVLLAADSTPKITDFGLAKRLDGAGGQTASGAVVGTPSYMAPEQAGGRSKESGPATDVYALGAILYELLTGRPPFKAATPLDTVLQVLRDEPVPPRQLAPMTPRDLETVCLKCLAKDHRQRYPSAADLAGDLRRFMESKPIQARPVTAWERARKWAKRRPAVAALLLVCGAAVLASVGLVTGAFPGAPLPRGGPNGPAKTDQAPDPLQPGSRWSGVFHFRGMDYSSDVNVRVTKRAGQQFEGVYTSERGQYEWLIGGTVGKGTIEWRFTRVVREKKPTGVVGNAHVKGTYQGESMAVVYQDATSTADMQLQLRK
jgi:tRNA A-37 threonylcarbamoyl transferase component Bud32